MKTISLIFLSACLSVAALFQMRETGIVERALHKKSTSSEKNPLSSEKKQSSSEKKPSQERKPNIVFFLVDDLGWKDVGFNGSTFYETPHLDSFAKAGMKFTNAYAACHVCSPTRGSILTGKYPARTGLTDWLPGRKDFPFQKFRNVRSIQHLPFEEETIAETLRDNGYGTAIFGKWHLGEEESNPTHHGFETRVPQWNKGWPNGSYFSPFNMKGLDDGPAGSYLTDRLTDEALKYIDANKDKPFFLYLSHFAVHDPIEGRPDLVKKYEAKLARMKKKTSPDFILESNPDTSHRFTREELNKMANDKAFSGYKTMPHRTVKIKQHQDNVQFAAMVESMDESFGRVMGKLKELGIDDNTIVVFFSDNGGMSAANFGNPYRVISEDKLDKAYSTSNLPLRAGKGWMYDGGIKEPMVISWPKTTKSGAICDVPVISTDFYPTILEMAGLPLKPQQHIDGISLAPLLKGGKKIDRDAVYWHFPHYSNHGLQSPGGAVRAGDFKLIEYFENGTVQLFNLAKDPGEKNDISASDPATAKRLTEMLHNWRKQVGAKMMQPNPNFQGRGISDKLQPLNVLEGRGLLGSRTNLWRDNRLWYVYNSDFLLSGFESRPGEHTWQGEHVGKWLHAAALDYEMTKDPKLLEAMKKAVDRLLNTQLMNGYLGTYADSLAFYNFPNDEKGWDVWTHRYNLYGLLVYESFHPDERIVDACKKIGDLLIDVYGEGKKDITKYGTREGISSTTILESIVMLYDRTGEKKYLDFAEHIVACSEKNPGLRLMDAMLKNETVVYPGNGKAYQLMANLIGYLRLYKATGNVKYLKTVLNGWEQIRKNHILVTGGPWTRKMSYNANKECFARTDAFDPWEIVVENCCTVTWIQLNIHLLELTGQAKYAEEAEIAMFNHFFGGQHSEGIDWCYYTKPNETDPPYVPKMHCCASSGPRALEMYSRSLASAFGNNVVINSFSPSKVALLDMFGNGHFEINSEFPFPGSVEIDLQPAKPVVFTVEFRIPYGAEMLALTVNGDATEAKKNQRGYYEIRKEWRQGDKVNISLSYQLNAHVQKGRDNTNWVAFTYGPLALTRKISAVPDAEPLLKAAMNGGKATDMLTPVKNGTRDVAFTVKNTDIMLQPYYQAGSRNSGPQTYFQISPGKK